jgi:hypothetical protein
MWTDTDMLSFMEEIASLTMDTAGAFRALGIGYETRSGKLCLHRAAQQ